jgi:ATP-dependent Lhr-like helicase
LYLLLTSNAREAFRSLDTLIIDEIHALVPTKRGAHLALSMERLEALAEGSLQRIGLSATQRAARRSRAVSRRTGSGDAGRRAEREPDRPDGGCRQRDRPRVHRTDGAAAVPARPITIVDAGRRKALRLKIEVPVEDMARLAEPIDIPSGPASQGPTRPSIWTAIHPAPARAGAVAHVDADLRQQPPRRRAPRRRAQRPRRRAARRAHHGSLARPQRVEIEDALKEAGCAACGDVSLELGIDMGAIDLVVQIEAPPSVASGLQRIGRAGHQVGADSEGLIFRSTAAI